MEQADDGGSEDEPVVGVHVHKDVGSLVVAVVVGRSRNAISRRRNRSLEAQPFEHRGKPADLRVEDEKVQILFAPLHLQEGGAALPLAVRNPLDPQSLGESGDQAWWRRRVRALAPSVADRPAAPFICSPASVRRGRSTPMSVVAPPRGLAAGRTRPAGSGDLLQEARWPAEWQPAACRLALQRCRKYVFHGCPQQLAAWRHPRGSSVTV